MTQVISVRFKPALLARINARTFNRSQWLAEAAEEKLAAEMAKTGRDRRTVGGLLSRFQGLEVTIPKASGKVKRVDL